MSWVKEMLGVDSNEKEVALSAIHIEMLFMTTETLKNRCEKLDILAHDIRERLLIAEAKIESIDKLKGL